MENRYEQCKRCAMDSTAEEFVSTETGCFFCDLALRMKPLPATLPSLSDKNNLYDVLIGLSGGADSSTALVRLVGMGVLPLCYSLDNGWQSPEAQENIMRLVEGLRVPFIRYRIDIKNYLDLQSSFMKSGVRNIEIPTDHILTAAGYDLASRYGIKTIISGGNWETESIMPESWGYQPRDLTHIKDIHKKFGSLPLKGFPLMGILKFNWYRWVKGIRVVNILDYELYDRKKAVEELSGRFGWKDYGEKHCESVFTSWFQNFYLFEKFGIDKRKAHYSSLILSGQMTRKEALERLSEPPVYPRLGIEKEVLSYPKHSHYDFRTDRRIWGFLSSVVRLTRRRK